MNALPHFPRKLFQLRQSEICKKLKNAIFKRTQYWLLSSRKLQNHFLRKFLRPNFDLNSNERSFQQEFGYEISFSRFYEFLRSQKQYIFNKKISQTSCLCEICENVVLLSKGIHDSLELQLTSNAYSIVEKYSYNSHSKTCMMGECEDCTPDKFLNVDGFNGKKDVKLFKWCRENKNMEKIEMTLKCDEAIKTSTSSVEFETTHSQKAHPGVLFEQH